MSDELADYEPSFVAFATVGAASGAVLGGLVGASDGELGQFPSDWQLGLYPLLPVLLAAVCYSLERGAGAAKSVLLAPVVAIARTCLAIAWFAGYFLFPLPAIGVFALLYGLLGWTPRSALLVAFGALVAWVFLLSRLPVAPLIDDFWDSFVRACGLLVAALLAVLPALVVGALLGYFLGFLDDPSWDGGGRNALVGAVLGGLYGLSVGLVVPITTMMVVTFVESDS
jgi:hypothetical protein